MITPVSADQSNNSIVTLLQKAYLHSWPHKLLPTPRLYLAGVPIAGLASVLANLCCLKIAIASGLSVQVSWALAFEVGTLVSFGSHQLITWRDHLPATSIDLLGRILRFQAGALVSLLLNLAIFTLLVHHDVPYLAADLAGIAAGFCLNTIVGLRYTVTR